MRDAGGRAGVLTAGADELRLGRQGRVRRGWAPRGVQVRQRVHLRDQGRALARAVAALTGRRWWRWLPNMRQETSAPVVAAWQEAGIAALVWDGAPAHRARLGRDVGGRRVTQPPAAPALNPVERVFQGLRRAGEGLVDATLAEQVAVVEREVTALAADPARLRQLTGWAWIAANLAHLPAPDYPAPS